MTEEDALTLATHRHYKGGLYRYLCDATHSETQEPLVIYEHIWPHERRMWVRPAVLFYGEHGGRRRFNPILHSSMRPMGKLVRLEDRPQNQSGALGMKSGDRIVYEIDGRHGVAGEFIQDGDLDVKFDDGTHTTVKWNHCHKE